MFWCSALTAHTVLLYWPFHTTPNAPVPTCTSSLISLAMSIMGTFFASMTASRPSLAMVLAGCLAEEDAISMSGRDASVSVDDLALGLNMGLPTLDERCFLSTSRTRATSAKTPTAMPTTTAASAPEPAVKPLPARRMVVRPVAWMVAWMVAAETAEAARQPQQHSRRSGRSRDPRR